MRKIAILLVLLPAMQVRMFGQVRKTPRFEVGPLVGTTTFGTTAVFIKGMRASYGGRITVNVHPRVALEYQLAYFPGDYDTSKTQHTGHLKLTAWEEKHGILRIFALIGPGFMREHDSYSGAAGYFVYTYDSIAVEYGAGVELVPHRRYSVRLDLTDFYAGQKFTGYGGNQRFWDHHVDFKAAVMFRF